MELSNQTNQPLQTQYDTSTNVSQQDNFSITFPQVPNYQYPQYPNPQNPPFQASLSKAPPPLQQTNQQNPVFYQQLVQLQSKQMDAIQYDFDKSWSQDNTILKSQLSCFCIGEDRIVFKSSTLGEIEFKTSSICKSLCGCFGQICDPYGESEFGYRLVNDTNFKTAVSIEQCCEKTAIVRYKGIIIGKVERLCVHCCGIGQRYLIKFADKQKSPILLKRVCDTGAICGRCFPFCSYVKNIDVIKNGAIIGHIKNSHVKQRCQPYPCSLHEISYGRGDITMNANLLDDEKVLIVCGWMINNLTS